MLFLLPLVGAAVGVAVGAFATHAVGEEDRQAAKYHRQVANDLSSKYSSLEKRYNEYTEKSKRQIHDLTQQRALDEVEKDLLRLAIRLQQCLYTLMWDIDDNPTRESLIEFEKAVLATNTVLFELREEFIQVPDKYFSRHLERASEVIEEIPGDVLVGDIYPIKQCINCGQKNRIIPHNLSLNAICGNCRASLQSSLKDGYAARQGTEGQKSTSKVLDQDGHQIPVDNSQADRQRTEEQRSTSKVLDQVISILNQVPGMTQAHNRDFDRAVSRFKLCDGSVVKTWKNPVGVDHVFLADKSEKMIFGGFVGWIHADGFDQAIAQIQKDFT